MTAPERDRFAVQPSLPVDPDSRRNALVVILLFLLASVLAGGGGAFYFRTEAAEIYEDANRQVRLLSDIKVRQLVQWRRERLGDAQVLFERNSQSMSVVDALGRGDTASLRQVSAWLGSYLGAYGEYDRAFLVARDGTMRASFPNDAERPSAALMREATAALATRAPTFVDFHRDDVDGLPHLALVIPVIPGSPEGTPIGTMILRIDPRAFIYPALQVEQGNSSTGDTELLRRDGDSLMVLNHLRFDPGSALTLRVPASGDGRLDAIAAAGTTGLVRGVDYRGEDALGFVAAVGDSPWILVTRVEIAELESGLRRHLWLVTTGVVLLLGAVGTALLIWRRDQRLRTYQKQVQLAAALQESEERLRLALASASQGLYDLDLQSGTTIVSPEYAMMLGHDPAAFTESLESWRARVHPDDRPAASAALDDYLSGRTSNYHVEFRLATESGGWKWVLSVGQIVERDPSGAPKRMIGTHTDITDMKWAQEGQVRVAAQLRSLLANSPTVVYSVQIVGGQLRPVAISENVERILGYTPLEVMQPGFWDTHVHPDDRERVMPGPLGPRDAVTHVYRFRSGRGEYRWIQDHVTVLRRGANDLPTELVGAWSDITAQHEAQQALRASEERLRLAMASAKQGLWDLNLVTRVAITSPDYATMLGFDPATFVETADEWNARVHPDDVDRTQQVFVEYVAGTRPDYDVECRQRTADGRWLWVRSVGRIIERAPDGSPVRMLGIHTDIEARKTAEITAERLSRLYLTRSACNAAIVRCSTAEELFPQVCRALVEAGGFDMAWVGIVDPSTHNVDVVASHGWGLEYLDTVSVSADPASPRSNGPAGTAIKENRATWVDDFAVNPNTSVWHRDAMKFGWVAAASFPLRESHRVIGALTIYLRSLGVLADDVRELLTKMSDDISFALDVFAGQEQRNRAEARLRQSEGRYRTLFADSGVPMLLIDPSNGRISDANAAAATFYGWDTETLRTMSVADINTMDQTQIRDTLQHACAVARGRFSFTHRTSSGDTRKVEAFTARVVIEEQPRLLAIIVDVTAQRLAEAALREQEHMLVEAQRLAHLGSWSFGGNGKMSWSEEMFRLFGLPPGSPVPPMEDFSRMVHPEDWPLVQQTMSDNLRGKLTPDIEYRALLPDGSTRFVSARGELRSDPVIGDYLTGTMQDITERKRAAETLTQSEERLRLALGAARQGLWDYDIVHGTALNSLPNPNGPGFGADMVEATSETFLLGIHPDDRTRVGNALASYASGQVERYEEEFRLEIPGTGTRWVQSIGHIVERQPDGTPTRIVGVVTDITERRAFLEALRSRDRAIESAQSAIAIADLDGNLTFVNHAFAEMFEMDREQTAGQSIVRFAEDPAQLGAIVGELMATGRPWTGELRGISRSGRHFDILLSAALVIDEQRQPTGIVGALLDVTDRKLNEQAMAASLEEKEALLKEVHHRVKNNLQVISSLLRLELGRTADGGVKAVLGEMQNRVVSMALLHETLYRSDNLARADLSSYLVRLVNQLFRSSAPPSGRVVLHTDIEPTFVDLEQAVPCGLLVTELVSNSLKHAFADGRSGEVRVTLHHPDNGPRIVLTVSDTGPGLPADFDARRTQSLGLQLVSDLTRQLRGTLTITRQPSASFALAFTPRATTSPTHG